MKVYTPQHDFQLQKIKAAAKLYAAAVDFEVVGFQAKISDGLREAYPHHRMPAMQIQNGQYIFGTHTILIHLSGAIPSVPISGISRMCSSGYKD